MSLTKLQPGQPAPPLELPNEEEHRVSLQDFAGQPVLVSFLSHAA